MINSRPIPGYEGKYWITPEGEVTNAEEHELKPIMTKSGKQVELRKNGQRELVPVSILIEITWREL